MISTGQSEFSFSSSASPGGWQEHLDAKGNETLAWQPFLERLRSTPSKEIRRWHESIARELRQDGLTFTLNRAGTEPHQREQVDPIPWIFDAQQWSEIEQGVEQRARLLEAVVQDLMGPRTLITRGVIPAELIFADPAYLRPCVGLPSLMGAHLFHVGVDLARGPEGKFWVLDDQTQAPSGGGFALESRTIMGRIFPQLMNEMPVRRLSSYFRTFRESMLQMYQGRQLEPRTVLLSPGPYNPYYFEHAYLASYLGYTLVQGSDLIVRNGSVRLKTLEGLQPVDIVYRYVKAGFLDPLELRRDSFLGVPGLIGAMRAGKVSTVNHPGCGLLENSGLMAFFPLLCRELLGEELLLPSVATWWCGQSDERTFVLENLSKLIVKPLQRSWKEPGVDGSLCSRAELEKLRRNIEAYPEGYVGQERVEFSRLPVTGADQVETRPARLRAFACATPDGYQVMPGALARAVPPGGGMDIAGKGMIKDVWVIGENPEPHRSLWIDKEVAAESTRFQGVFTSRSAENLYWVGRYADRVIFQARLLSEMGETDLAQPESKTQTVGELRKMLELMERVCGEKKPRKESNRKRLKRAVCGEESTGSLSENLKALVSSAYTVRDIWSQDSWRILVSLESVAEELQECDPEKMITSPVMGDLLDKLNAFQGILMSSMSRESGWSMLMLGRNLEGALGLCESIRVLLGPANRREDPVAMMELLLQQNTNIITYRRHYRTTPRMKSVLELVTASEQNPRSLVFYLEQIPLHLDQLPPPTEPEVLMPSILGIKQLRARLLDENGLHADEEGEFPLLQEIRTMLETTSDVVSSAFFSHTTLRPREEY